jgi:hypothetical protein
MVWLISGYSALAIVLITIALTIEVSSGSGVAGSLTFGGITCLDKAQMNKNFVMIALVALNIVLQLGVLAMVSYQDVLQISKERCDP